MSIIKVGLADGRTEWFQAQYQDEQYETEISDDGTLTVYLTRSDTSGNPVNSEEAALFTKDEWLEVEELSR